MVTFLRRRLPIVAEITIGRRLDANDPEAGIASSNNQEDEDLKTKEKSSSRWQYCHCGRRAITPSYVKWICTVVLLCWGILWLVLSQQILVIYSIDLSLVLHRLAKAMGRCDGWKYTSQLDSSGRVQCRVNLCHIVHEGGEGILFAAKCYNHTNNKNGSIASHPVIPALHKSVKFSNFKTAYYEILATRRLSRCSESPLRVWAGGVNFLTLTQLNDYIPLEQPLEISSLQAYLTDIGRQLACLHRGGYLHRDVYNKNILMSARLPYVHQDHPFNQSFQLIDASSSILLTNQNAWQWALESSLHGLEKQHLPLPPALVCRLAKQKQTTEEKEYCRRQENLPPCLEWLDRYSLGVQALRLIYPLITGKALKRAILETSIWKWRLAQHEIWVGAVDELSRLLAATHQESVREQQRAVVQTIHQLIVLDNRTETCH